VDPQLALLEPSAPCGGRLFRPRSSARTPCCRCRRTKHNRFGAVRRAKIWDPVEARGQQKAEECEDEAVAALEDIARVRRRRV
jgi:hypothetical protein